MQQLKQRTKKNTPTNTSQVRSNCGLLLNKEETLSVVDLKTRFNNPEVNLHQHHTGGLKDVVYVISLEGNPLIPCLPAKARKLIKNGKAKIIKLYPFTIMLNFECENQIQEITLGIDSGYKNIGFSCVSSKQELISGTVSLDDKTSERLTEKRMYRRGRRNKLWYRKPRFLNRKKKEGWLPPSIQRKYDTHLNLIKRLKTILPITEVIIETANFDIQKIENPIIEGVDYQQGNMYGYQNLRSFLMVREKGLCQLCSKEFTKGNSSHIHHCKPRSENGSNRPKNLALLHEKCHVKLHKKNLKLNPAKSYKPNTFMSIIQKKFWNDIPNLKVTYGYITFLKRQENNISKSHNNDAFVIANGTTQIRCSITSIRQKHRNNRGLQLNRKGFEPSIRKQRYKIQPKDLVWVDNKKYIVVGVQNKGSYVKVENTKKVLSVKNIKRIYNYGSFSFK
jgi:hypothetical protein